MLAAARPGGTGSAFDRLVRVIAALRGPDGCPWDREQSVASVRRYLLTETYEALEALSGSDIAAAREELGDVLFQIAFLARLYEESGAFDLGGLADAAADKMTARHPHVFADPAHPETSADEVFRSWDSLKARARGESPGARSLLDGVPQALPALARALELSDRAASQGFDWPDLPPVLAKLDEELAELGAAITSQDRAAIEAELGDVLFVVANLARKLKADPEAALHATNAKFIRRFRHIEQTLRELGSSPRESSLSEMDRLWNEAKGRGL